MTDPKDTLSAVTNNSNFSVYRYQRNIDLPSFGMEGQISLTEAKVCIVGAGGLGCPVALYLAASGIGNITLIDNDEVSITNLQRQILYSSEEVGELKVDAGQKRLAALNPKIKISAINNRLTEENIKNLLANYTVIVDCSDNYETRYLINKTARQLNITLVSGAVVHYDGQVFVFKENAPCYACLFPTPPDSVTAPVCVEAGVLGPVVGVIGTLMGVEVIKEICKIGLSLAGSFLSYSALNSEFQKFKFSTKTDCPICSGKNHV
jgi:molybdopterin/thiamine biosynthesis adenylyltransferase